MTTIRPAVAADLDSLVALLQILFSIEEDFQFEAKRQRAGLKLMLANEQGCILVAECNKQVVGMCSGQLMISTAEGGAALIVEDVVVADEYRKQGIGKRLITGITDWAETKKVKRLQLLADQNNQDAVKFYQSIGWAKTQLICLRKNIL